MTVAKNMRRALLIAVYLLVKDTLLLTLATPINDVSGLAKEQQLACY
ncbi:MAG: hypothetical protein ACI8RT_000431 [Candidatus Azotimanducaceae bacterium]|jgi:hypothetical protein|tara:strand:- start:432 stop:572 length:141 start_codon:yes stop_codon:yes gene_type:complete